MLRPATPPPHIIHKGVGPVQHRPIVFYDQETFGFGRNQPIIEVAGFKRYPSTGRTEEFISKIAVTSWEIDHAEAGALKVTAFDPSEWSGAPERIWVLRTLYNMLAGARVVAFNVWGDIARLESEFAGPGFFHDESAGPTPGLPRNWCQPDDLAHELRLRHPEWGKWSLDEACRRLGIPEEAEHRAMGGAQRTMQVWDAMYTATA